jgi:hypothetical protein
MSLTTCMQHDLYCDCADCSTTKTGEAVVATRNAVIEKATLLRSSSSVLVELGLLYSDACQLTGKYQASGWMIRRIMEVADVDEWSLLPGKSIRVKASRNEVSELGHFLKDDWIKLKEAGEHGQ